MKNRLITILICLFLVGIFYYPLAAQINFTDTANKDSPDASYIADELVVDLKDNLPDGQMQKMMVQYNLRLVSLGVFPKEKRIMVAKVQAGQVSYYKDLLSRDPNVETVEPNYIYQAYSKPNDPYFKYQWNMDMINVRGAWKLTAGQGVIVAVIDTGVSQNLEDMNTTKFVGGYNFVANNKNSSDDNGHGSHVAGTIAQSTNNGKGVIGASYEAKIMPIKVLSAGGYGSLSSIAQGIRFAADNGAKVINMSLGGKFYSKILEDACRYAHSKGVIIVCAAGNDSTTSPGYPAAYKYCISVSAVNYHRNLTTYTTRGNWISLSAPGGDFQNLSYNERHKSGIMQNTIHGYPVYRGTSMACPHVSAVAAMLVSIGVTEPEAVRKFLQSTTETKGIKDKLAQGYGSGIVNADRAVLKGGLLMNFLRLVAGFLLGVVLLFVVMKKAGLTYLPLNIPLLSGLVIGSCGLFFLPYIGFSFLPLKNIICAGLPQWDIAVFGATAHQNPLFYSALVPFILAVLFIKNSFIRPLVIGLSLGVAAHLLVGALWPVAFVKYLPAKAVFTQVWLVVNMLICLVIAWDLFFDKDGTYRQEVG